MTLPTKIPPRAVVKFKAGKEMKAKVMKLSQTIGDGTTLNTPGLPEERA